MRNNSRQFSFYLLRRKSPFFDSAIPYFRTMSLHAVSCSVEQSPEDATIVGLFPVNKIGVPIISAYTFTEARYAQ